MLIYPAIDLVGGHCVRLAQGLFENPTIYSDDPGEALARFAEAGAVWTHVVDLDGARERRPMQHDLIAGLAREARQRLQVAGGFRKREQIARMLDAGAARVVIGSLAATDPETTRALLDEFGPERITLAFDVRLVGGDPQVAAAGWRRSTGQTVWEVASLYPQARHAMITDIGRDGMLSGPNVELIAEFVRAHPGLDVQASGGVASADDLRALAGAGAAGAIVGKALWEGRIALAEAIDAGG